MASSVSASTTALLERRTRLASASTALSVEARKRTLNGSPFFARCPLLAIQLYYHTKLTRCPRGCVGLGFVGSEWPYIPLSACKSPFRAAANWILTPHSSSCAIVVPKVRVCCARRRRLLPVPGTRTVATTLSRCTSRPAQRSTITSITRPPSETTRRRRLEGPPAYDSAVRARGGSQRFRRPPRHTPYRARSSKRMPASTRRRRHSHSATVAATSAAGTTPYYSLGRFEVGGFASGCCSLRPLCSF